MYRGISSPTHYLLKSATLYHDCCKNLTTTLRTLSEGTGYDVDELARRLAVAVNRFALVTYGWTRTLRNAAEEGKMPELLKISSLDIFWPGGEIEDMANELHFLGVKLEDDMRFCRPTLSTTTTQKE